MKKVNLIIFALIAIAFGIYFFGSKYSLGGLSFNQDKGHLEKQMNAFLEDIQFKDFDKAATYHHPSEQKKANISHMIESKFHIKPEQLDIQEYTVDRVDIDNSGNRARILTTVHIKLLNTKEVRDVEAIYFWHKKDGKWYMMLRSSL